MSSEKRIANILSTLLRLGPPPVDEQPANEMTNVAGQEMPNYSESEIGPESVEMTTVVHPDGRMSQYPPADKWHDWVEYDGKNWPRKIARRYTLIPTVCFNCESACGLLAYVDKTTYEIRKFEGNPAHPGSRGRNCAKGPATLNQIYDPERILYPLKRVGERGEGRWKRVSWDEALDTVSNRFKQVIAENGPEAIIVALKFR